MSEPDLTEAAETIETAAQVVRDATRKLAETGSIDADQVLAYDLAHAAAAIETARSMLDYGAKGEMEGKLTCVFVADVVADLAAKLWGRESIWGCESSALDATRSFVATWRDPALLAAMAHRRRPSTPRRRVRACPGLVPALRRGTGSPSCRAHPP